MIIYNKIILSTEINYNQRFIKITENNVRKELWHLKSIYRVQPLYNFYLLKSFMIFYTFFCNNTKRRQHCDHDY